ncbi:adenylyltransferase/cytidyltransferase family protein [bacterium]|nr:adenylyltransferase/cytidyltransferase family protein [bacterium]
MKDGRKIVLCHGKFDVLHIGHLMYLQKAKELGNYLVVSITAASYLTHYPRFDDKARVDALKMLSWVDEIYICHDKTGCSAIDAYKPDYYAKGPDYMNWGDPILEREKTTVELYGGELVIIEHDVEDIRSTELKNNKDNPFCKLSNEEYNLTLISEFIKKAENIAVNIIGETIIDVFQTVELNGQSAKSSCPAFSTINGLQEQQGGAAIIARHLSNFCANVDLHTNDYPIRKLRYIDRFRNKKHLEIKTVGKPEKDFCPELNDTFFTIVADFGHGLLDNYILPDNPLYVMVQTNSCNFGYNLVSKWNAHKAQLVCLDRVEGSLLLGEKFEDVDEFLMKRLFKKLNAEAIILTMHSGGSIYYDCNGNYATFPALTAKVVDTIGAGDAFFTFASLAHYCGFRKDEILLIASIAAAVSTQWLCNANSITPKELLKAAKVIL